MRIFLRSVEVLERIRKFFLLIVRESKGEELLDVCDE